MGDEEDEDGGKGVGGHQGVDEGGKSEEESGEDEFAVKCEGDCEEGQGSREAAGGEVGVEENEGSAGYGQGEPDG